MPGEGASGWGMESQIVPLEAGCLGDGGTILQGLRMEDSPGWEGMSDAGENLPFGRVAFEVFPQGKTLWALNPTRPEAPNLPAPCTWASEKREKTNVI